MDISSLMGGGRNPTGNKPSKQEKPPALEYTAQVASPLVTGEVKLTIGEDSLSITALFDAADIPYAEITALTLADYTVTIKTNGDDFTFSRMGNWCQPFYDTLLDAYNKKVQKVLFIQGQPLLAATGEYRYIEGSATSGGSAAVQVHDNCVCFLPPDLDARRIPLCFVTDMKKGDYELALCLDTGECYTFSKLGYDTAPFADAVEKQVRNLREKSLTAVREIDPSLTTAQASSIGKLMPEGAAAPFSKLSEIAPSFVAALEAKIADSRAAETYKEFQGLCDPAQIYVGFKKNTARGGGKDVDAGSDPERMLGGLTGSNNPLGAMGGLLSDDANEGGVKLTPDPYLLWLIAPSPDGGACAVEFAGDPGDAAATFIYRFSGGFDTFARQLNRALEAIDFKREVIRLTDTELLKPEYQDYRMAVQRNTALQLVRSCFAGRVIHNSDWKRSLQELWSLVDPKAAAARFCASCGAESPPGVKFCGACGTKL